MKALTTILALISLCLIFCEADNCSLQLVVTFSGIALLALAGKLYEKYCMTKEEKEMKV